MRTPVVRTSPAGQAAMSPTYSPTTASTSTVVMGAVVEDDLYVPGWRTWAR